MQYEHLIHEVFHRFPMFEEHSGLQIDQLDSIDDIYTVFEEYFIRYIVDLVEAKATDKVALTELEKIAYFLEELSGETDEKVLSLVQVGILEGVMSHPETMWAIKSSLLPRTRKLAQAANKFCDIDYNIT